MNTNAILKKEGIEITSQLTSSQINKIADIVSSKICHAFPEHHLNERDVCFSLSNVAMYFAKMPEDSGAKYFSRKQGNLLQRTIRF